jgi:hypothetical protein
MSEPLKNPELSYPRSPNPTARGVNFCAEFPQASPPTDPDGEIQSNFHYNEKDWLWEKDGLQIHRWKEKQVPDLRPHPAQMEAGY